MFDLKYYNEISKTNEYLEKDKARGSSRSHLHELRSHGYNKKQFWINRINEIPQEEVKNYMLLEYNRRGETALTKMVKEITTHLALRPSL